MQALFVYCGRRACKRCLNERTEFQLVFCEAEEPSDHLLSISYPQDASLKGLLADSSRLRVLKKPKDPNVICMCRCPCNGQGLLRLIHACWF